MRFPIKTRLAELAQIAGAQVSGDPAFEIMGMASLEHAAPDEISFVRSAKWKAGAQASKAGALLVTPEYGELDRPGLIAPNADAALARLGMYLTKAVVPTAAPGVHESASVAEGVELGEGASVGPCAVIERGVKIGKGASIGSGAFVGRGVTIGDGTRIGANVSVMWGSVIGSRCEIHSGAVIGSDGFGFMQLPDGTNHKLPQLGNVVIGEDVEIGACCTIDRATLDSTVLSKGVKLDNLVHIAHNCIIGENTVMAAMTAIAGSTVIGKNCQFGGKAGVSGHLKIGDGVRIGGSSTVFENVEAGMEVWGYPAMEKEKALRNSAVVARAVELRSEVRQLKARVEELEKRAN